MYLPKEILEQIIMYLSIKDINNTKLISSDWNNAVDGLWKRLLKRSYGIDRNNLYKEKYKQLYLTSIVFNILNNFCELNNTIAVVNYPNPNYDEIEFEMNKNCNNDDIILAFSIIVGDVGFDFNILLNSYFDKQCIKEVHYSRRVYYDPDAYKIDIIKTLKLNNNFKVELDNYKKEILETMKQFNYLAHTSFSEEF